MSTSSTKEAAFEAAIEAHLLEHGYHQVASGSYDMERAVFADEATAFIQATQPETWDKLEAMLGEKTGEQVVTDLVKWLDNFGSLDVLRHGFKCYGKRIQMAYFRPAHGMNPELAEHYASNRLGITRQLRYHPEHPRRSIDTVLSLNGVPLVTMELKNAMSGSTVTKAEEQYEARDPYAPIFEFKRRALVHFAVDTDLVRMCTRLQGGSTTFLPFDKGKPLGEGRGRTAGNPADPHDRDYRTAYLWEEVLSRDSLLELVQRYLHLHTERKVNDEGKSYKKEVMIFPRYHQRRAVKKLVSQARDEGAGHNYLVEHSTGSGKSFTISWLAHQLSSLHSERDERVFDSVVVVTDRRVLDQQLQSQIYAMEHRNGVVKKIDQHSRQLAEALDSAVPIIITTMQKFPFVTEHLREMNEAASGDTSGGEHLPTRRCAVIIDEAHSSQHGDISRDLKAVLGGQDLVDKAQEMAEEEGREDEEKLFRELLSRAQQDTISFFAFTGTPKYKTLVTFGDEDGEPHDRYSMRQAMEEEFIMDVLKHYTTYDTFYRLLKERRDDPEVERKKAAKALSRYMRLHPHNISQKTMVMLEHFHQMTRHKIGGKAKAMVVTSSRLAAVRYKRMFDKMIRENGYNIRSLVAFSGAVDDEETGHTYTEESMNDGISEREVPSRFSSSEYQVLLVAEKYQTGFDEPLLHTMYIDRRLAGLQAVQTLSRLNRVHPLKEDTFVLDFRNDREEIKDAFSRYYDGAEMGEAPDPSRMYTIKRELDRSGIYHQEEVDQFCKTYYKPSRRQTASDHKKMDAALNPAVDRFVALKDENEEEAAEWKRKMNAYRNLYSFVSQVIPYQDSDLERLYTYLRHLARKLPRRDASDSYRFDDDVRLEYYRLQKISEGSIDLSEGYEGPTVSGPTETGTGTVREDPVALSRLIDQLNERFGTDFTDADQLFFDQVIEDAMDRDDLREAARANPRDKFGLVFTEFLKDLIVGRMDQNEEIFGRWTSDRRFRTLVDSWLTDEAYERFTE